jgi:hypothetical protein
MRVLMLALLVWLPTLLEGFKPLALLVLVSLVVLVSLLVVVLPLPAGPN